MKRIISIIIALCLVFGSFSFAFADEWGSSQISSVVNNVSSINTTLSNIYTRVNTITNYLTDSNHSVAYWTSAIASWMQPIYQALTSNLAANLNLEPIIAGLNEVVSNGTDTSYFPYLKYNGKSNANWLSDIYTNGFKMAGSYNNVLYRSPTNTGYSDVRVNRSGYGLLENLYFYLSNGMNDQNTIYYYEYMHRDRGFDLTQSLVSFADPDSTVLFTPLSATDGLYKYLNAINTPLARLGYVLASDSRIEAQEAAAANEQAVVDNFIDSSGNGSVSDSDFGSMADASGSFKDNFDTGQSASGIWNVFDRNYDWFSQTTANNLQPSLTRDAEEYSTSYLDEYYKELDSILEVNKRD